MSEVPESPPIEDENVPDIVSIPHSRAAEEASLGAVFIGGENVLSQLKSILKPEDFYVHRHRWIWEAFLDLDAFHRPIDLLTVSERLDDKKQLAEVGGPAYITALINQVPTTYNAKHYASIVEAFSVRRKLIAQANSIAKLAYDTTKDIDTVLHDHQQMMEAVDFESSFEGNTKDSDVTSLELLEMVEADVPLGVITGFPHFDSFDALGGHPVGATLLIGDSSFGKSAWELQKCEQIAEHFGHTVIYFGLESKSVQNVIRRISGQTSVKHLSKKIRSATLSRKEKDLVANSIQNYQGRFGDPSRLLFNSEDRTLLGIERAIRRYRPKYATIDQINQITDHISPNPTINLLEKFTRLKAIGQEYDVAMSVVHAISAEESRKFFDINEQAQKGRDKGQAIPKKNKLPDINAIPWATQMKFVADVILFLVPEVNQKLIGAKTYKINIWIMKDRDGDRFVWTKWDYDLQSQWFTDLAVKTIGSLAQVPSGVK